VKFHHKPQFDTGKSNSEELPQHFKRDVEVAASIVCKNVTSISQRIPTAGVSAGFDSFQEAAEVERETIGHLCVSQSRAMTFSARSNQSGEIVPSSRNKS